MMIGSDFEMIFDNTDSLEISYDFNSESFKDDLHENNKKWEVERIVCEYLSDDELSVGSVHKLKNDNDFRCYLLKNVKDRMENIIVNNSTEVYKELVTVINLLSHGEKYRIFEDYNKYSISEISNLLTKYQSLLVEYSSFFSDNNVEKKDFEITFDYYTTLLDAFKELCIVNLIDVVRKKTIQGIIDVITENINIIKFTVTLDEHKISVLNTFQGELLLRFSNITYVTTENKEVHELIHEYKFIYNKQVDGYHMSSNSQLNVTERNKCMYHKTFLSITTNLLLLLITKLEKYENISIDKLSEVVSVYTQECQLVKININSIEEFKDSLLNNFVYIYDDTLNIQYQELIKHILDKNNLSVFNMKIIHNIILFSHVHDNNLMYILRYMIKVPKVDNDFHEYHKLRIIDSIINQFIQRNGNDSFTKQIPSVLDYMKNSNTATNLMSVFSKIRLSLSHYFSLLGEKYLMISQEQYFIGETICSYTLIKNEYKSIYETILLNNAKVHFKSLSLSPKLNDNELIIFGKNMMKHFFVNKEVKIKYDVSTSFEKIIEYILKSKDSSLGTVEEHISSIVSQKIFFKLAVCKMIDLGENSDDFQEVGYEVFEQDIINGYKIIYKYSFSYQDSFYEIFNKNENYIKKSITNILLSYLNLE